MFCVINFVSLCIVTAVGVHMDNQSLLIFYMSMNLQDVSRLCH